MRPNRELPIIATDEVRMVIGNSAVVNDFLNTRVEDILDNYLSPSVAAQQITRQQQTGGQPAQAVDVERMLAGCTDDLPLDVNVPDATDRPEDLFDLLEFNPAIRMILIARCDLAAWGCS